MNKLLTVLAPVAVLALGIGAYVMLDLTAPEPEKKDDPVRPLSVYVSPVAIDTVALTVQTGGEVRARTSVDLVAQVAGRVTAVSPEFIEGGRVTPDSVLVQIEQDDYYPVVLQAEAEVAAAEVGVQQAEADANVARRQLRGASNATALALKRPQVAQAKSRLKAARAQLARAQTDLKRTRLALPFDGRVVSTMVDVGQYVAPGSVLGRAFATDVVEVRLPLTDGQLASLDLPIGYVAEDQGLPVTLEATVAGRTQRWLARLTRLDASIESQTRLTYGIAEVVAPYTDNVSELGMPLAVGLYVNATIHGREIAEVMVIPREGLRAGNQAYVVNANGRLEVRDVEVAHSDADRAVISQGLQVDEQVVVSSVRNPVQGMSLHALNEAGGAALDHGQTEVAHSKDSSPSREG